MIPILLFTSSPKSKIANSKFPFRIWKTTSRYNAVRILFRDSLQFLTFFLDSLVKSLAKTKRQNFFLLHETMQNIFPDATDEIC